MSDSIERMRVEAKHIADASLLAAERHYAAETPWYHWNYGLGIPSTILAAVASAAAFSKIPNSQFVAGGISIVVAVLSSLTTFLDPNKKASAFHNSAKAYETLYHNAGFFFRIESHGDDANVKELEKRLGVLASKFNELNQNSLAISGRAYRIAEEKLNKGKGEVVRDPNG